MYQYIKNTSLLKKYLFIGFSLHLISSYFSIGFYSDDEHYQILEPVAYLLGINDILLKDNSHWYWEWELKYWDIAAGIIILKEAGGFVDFMEPGPQSSLKRNVIATNSQIHQELQESLLKKNIE